MILIPGALCAGFDANSGNYFQLLLVIIKETVRNLFFFARSETKAARGDDLVSKKRRKARAE